jgi:hypothetical protein
MSKKIKIGITGHRNLFEKENVKESLRQIIRKILKDQGADTFEAWSGMAYGADSIFAHVSIDEMHAGLTAVLPFDLAEFNNDFNTEESLNDFHFLYERAQQKIVLNEGKPIENKQMRNAAYFEYGLYISKNVDAMIAIWDGEPAEGEGGTADIVHFCDAHNIPIYSIKAYRTDIQKKRIELNEEAIIAKRKFHNYWQICILFSWISAVIFAANLALDDILTSKNIGFFLACTETSLIVAVIIILRYINKHEIKKQSIIKRRESELLRVVDILHQAGISLPPLPKDEFISNEVFDLQNRIFAIENKKFNLEEARKKINKLLDSQVHYHSQARPKKLQKPLYFWQKIQHFTEYAFFAVVFVDLFTAFQKTGLIADINFHLPHDIFLFLSLVLPPSYIAIESLKYFGDWKRLIKESRMMADFLGKQKENLRTAQTEGELTLIAEQIREKLDEENGYWTLLVDSKEKPASL